MQWDNTNDTFTTNDFSIDGSGTVTISADNVQFTDIEGDELVHRDALQIYEMYASLLEEVLHDCGLDVMRPEAVRAAEEGDYPGNINDVRVEDWDPFMEVDGDE